MKNNIVRYRILICIVLLSFSLSAFSRRYPDVNWGVFDKSFSVTTGRITVSTQGNDYTVDIYCYFTLENNTLWNLEVSLYNEYDSSTKITIVDEEWTPIYESDFSLWHHRKQISDVESGRYCMHIRSNFCGEWGDSYDITLKGDVAISGAALSYKQNYIQAIKYTEEDGSNSLKTVQYYDGLGRATQIIERAITPSMKDLVTILEYDNLGRKTTTWLPGLSDRDGKYAEPRIVKASSKGVTMNNDQTPYSKSVYENSPFTRVIEQFNPGHKWHTGGKSIKTQLLTNNSNHPCLYFYIQGEKLMKGNYYKNGELYVTEIRDEDNNPSYEFKNKLGQVILTRSINIGDKLDTYYIYDDFGNLRYVLPPLAIDNLSKGLEDESEMMKQYAYIYKYDKRQRCIAKRLPGVDWIYYLYDNVDQILFSQDGEQRLKKESRYYSYDSMDRLWEIGIVGKTPLDDPNEVRFLDEYMNEFGGSLDEIKSDISCKSANYYDGYDFIQRGEYYLLSGEIIKVDNELKYEKKIGYDTRYGEDHYKVEHKGLLTATATSIEGKTNGYLLSVMFYDKRKRVIQSRSMNHMGGVDVVYTAYNFADQPINMLKEQTVKVNGVDIKNSEQYVYTYDHAGRLLITAHRLNNASPILLAESQYDELGRRKSTIKLDQTKLASNYKYNVRSWVTNIGGAGFNQNIYYENNPYEAPASFSGNISAMDYNFGEIAGNIPYNKWKRGYSYYYDGLSRLVEAKYIEEGNYEDAYYFSAYYKYDKQGNILDLQRMGNISNPGDDGGRIDVLDFNYKGNQLLNVTNYIGSRSINIQGAENFKDYADKGVEYLFNKNGAMTQDLNKGISEIQYNSLNLPLKMDIKSPVAEARNEYLYNANGVKLRVTQKWNPNYNTTPIIGSGINQSLLSKTKTTDYVDNKIYENNSLKRILIDGGYIEDGKYYLYIQDYLGNNRVVSDRNGLQVQLMNYYPFGMSQTESYAENKQPYKYNGKELDKMHGVNLYDYSARHYDATVVRFMSMDPLAEKYYSISPYAYCGNNPIKRIDPTGMWYDDYFDEINGKYLGDDDGVPGKMRLINRNLYFDIKNSNEGTVVDRMNRLQAAGTRIIIDDTKIQSDLQKVADLSSTPNAEGKYQEHQVYLTLNRQTATISSVMGEPGIQNKVTLSYFPAPITGVNYVDKPGGLILISQAHGHPPAIRSNEVTAKTMSRHLDMPTSASVNIPIYGLDAMDGSTNGKPTSIHRVTPDGTITNNVGRTSSNFNIGREAMSIWGRRR